ncbi:predicted protein [Nematostella vectensis]|uniref:Uncharacterized protein n=1 Tax=Nematostella vectensis TaxID=45351 RepID=A7T103_NEMVE|nr:uncharacterized protein LOC5501108 [Nematostella vectensis]EDO30359.1 predicted protein [Nematostella vectensis]|eukprot:XP_001622459.1 predicted protein [Nematostella vectensis]
MATENGDIEVKEIVPSLDVDLPLDEENGERVSNLDEFETSRLSIPTYQWTTTEDDDMVEINADVVIPPIESLSESEETQNGAEIDKDMVIITEQDVEKLSYSHFEELTKFYSRSKNFDEWIMVDADHKSFQLKESLLLLSSVYKDDRLCCVVQ